MKTRVKQGISGSKSVTKMPTQITLRIEAKNNPEINTKNSCIIV